MPGKRITLEDIIKACDILNDGLSELKADPTPTPISPANVLNGERHYKKLFNAQSLRWHPDKNPGNASAAEKYKTIVEAKTILDKVIQLSESDRLALLKEQEDQSATFGEEVEAFLNNEEFKAFRAKVTESGPRELLTYLNDITIVSNLLYLQKVGAFSFADLNKLYEDHFKGKSPSHASVFLIFRDIEFISSFDPRYSNASYFRVFYSKRSTVIGTSSLKLIRNFFEDDKLKENSESPIDFMERGDLTLFQKFCLYKWNIWDPKTREYYCMLTGLPDFSGFSETSYRKEINNFLTSASSFPTYRREILMRFFDEYIAACKKQEGYSRRHSYEHLSYTSYLTRFTTDVSMKNIRKLAKEPYLLMVEEKVFKDAAQKREDLIAALSKAIIEIKKHTPPPVKLIQEAEKISKKIDALDIAIAEMQQAVMKAMYDTTIIEDGVSEIIKIDAYKIEEFDTLKAPQFSSSKDFLTYRAARNQHIMMELHLHRRLERIAKKYAYENDIGTIRHSGKYIGKYLLGILAGRLTFLALPSSNYRNFMARTFFRTSTQNVLLNGPADAKKIALRASEDQKFAEQLFQSLRGTTPNSRG